VHRITPTRADLVLAAIGLSLALGAALAGLTRVDTAPALVASTVPAAATLCYALFFAPPRPQPSN